MMKLYLKSIGAWKFIENAIVKPEQADEPLFYRASAIISSAVGSQLSYLVLTSDEDPETSAPCRLWRNIESHFQPRLKKNLAKLKCQFFATKIEPGEDVRKFIVHVNAIADQLNAIVGKGQPDGISHVMLGDHLAVVIEGIESMYPEAYNAMSLIPNLDFEQAISFMSSNCVRLDDPAENLINMSRLSSESTKPKKKCTHCGRIGHLSDYCYDAHPELRKHGGAAPKQVAHVDEIPML